MLNKNNLDQNLINQLNQFRHLKPSADFALQSKRMIFKASSENSFGNSNNYTFLFKKFSLIGFALASLLVAIIINSLGNKPYVSASLNSANINKELDNVINIELKQINYEQKANSAVNSALTEISNNKTQHLNSSVIQSEEADFNIDESKSDTVDELLNQIIQ